MRLSFEEQSKLAAIHERQKSRRAGSWSVMLWSLVMPLVMCLHDLRKELHDPAAGKYIASFCAIGFLIGAAFAGVLVSGYFVAQQAKRERAMIAFMEKHFPDECPWKKEEAVLRQADELQREARISAILPQVETPR